VGIDLRVGKRTAKRGKRERGKTACTDETNHE
jgi:hypothetical protein